MAKMAAAWFRQEDWDQWRQIDPAWFPPTYEQWQSKFTLQLEDLASRGGVDIERVILDPAAFLKWCEDNKRKPNSESRRTYAAQRLLIKRTDH